MRNIIITTLLIISCSSFAAELIKNKQDPVYYFVNHTKPIEELRQKLIKGKTVGIVGITGIGKSEISRKYVAEYKTSYKIVGFIDCNTDINRQFLEFAKSINTTICKNNTCYISENTQNIKQNLMLFLQDREDWLLIFDNLHLGENHKIKDIIEWKHNGHIIIGSQDSKYLLYKVYPPYLDIENSKLLIDKIMQNTNVKIQDDMVKMFKGYPLLLGQSASFLYNNSYMNLESYEDYIKKHDNKVRAHLEMVYKTLTLPAKETLYVITLLNNQQVPKSLLKALVNDSTNLDEAINEVAGLGLITQIADDRNNMVFRMHDLLKNELLDIIGGELNSQNVNLILDKVNEFMPLNQTVPERYAIISQSDIQSNLEVLIKNAEKYKGNIYKIMRVRDILLDHYLKIADWSNCQKMSEWLIEKENLQEFTPSKMNNHEKAVYAHYLTNIGVTEDFSKEDRHNAIAFYNKAKIYIKDVEGYYLVHNTVSFQLALTQATIGDLQNAKENVKVIEKVLALNNKPLSSDRFLYVRSKIFLEEAEYTKALEDAHMLNASEPELYGKTVAAPLYALEAEVLYRMGRYKEAFDLSSDIYKLERKNTKDTNKLHARILIVLAASEVGLQRLQDATNHINIAIEILNKRLEKNFDLSKIKDVYLANAYLVKGDIASAEKRYEEAINLYNISNKIYHNVLDANLKLDRISYLYYKIAEAASKSGDYLLYKSFVNKHEVLFGVEHFRTLLLYKLKQV